MSRYYTPELRRGKPYSLPAVAAIGAATETVIWTPLAENTLFGADVVEPSQVWDLKVGGTITTTATAGNIQVRPRWGNSTSGTDMGISVAVAHVVSLTTVPFYIQATLWVRTLSTAATASATGTAVCTGVLNSQAVGAAAAPGQMGSLTFGGTVASVDTGLATAGLALTFTDSGASAFGWTVQSLAFTPVN